MLNLKVFNLISAGCDNSLIEDAHHFRILGQDQVKCFYFTGHIALPHFLHLHNFTNKCIHQLCCRPVSV